MKIFTFILSIYITALTLVPCSDGLAHKAENMSSEISMNHQDHNHPGQSQDDCSTFCSCACCGSLVVLPTTYHISQARVDLSSSYTFLYTFDYSFDYNKGVWHPPCIA
ncbi:DUF6660 family protein [uncultured Arcticibacterium sp.]|uniref:DUF6660 family protein n=1 Tax=uncultured Arcticibacterium sp. TaxID=2173042 RepID=UPI0030F50FE9